MPQKNFEKLLANLIKETRLQEKLLTFLAEERSSIVTLKTEKLQELQKKKEKLLSDISLHAEDRWSIIRDLGFTVSARNKNSFKLTECIEQCEDARLRASLAGTCEDLKTCAQSIKDFNAGNGDLLKTSLGVVSNTISIINARPAVADTNYKRDGKIHTQNSKAVHTSSSPVSSFSKSA